MFNKYTKIILAGVILTSAGYSADVNTQKNIGLSVANQITAAAVASCAAKGYNVTATVVDRAGLIVNVLRADNAGPHTLDSAFRKAFTSASMKIPSAVLDKNSKNPESANVKDINLLLALPGGLPIKVGAETIGAVGVGGAPSGNIDEDCAKDGLTKVASLLK